MTDNSGSDRSARENRSRRRGNRMPQERADHPRPNGRNGGADRLCKDSVRQDPRPRNRRKAARSSCRRGQAGG